MGTNDCPLFLSFIHSSYFYSASSCPPLLRGASDTARIVSEFHAEVTWTTVSEELAKGPYVAARPGFEPTTLRSTAIDSTNEPPRPTIVLSEIHYTLNASPIDSISSFILSVSRSLACLGLPLFPFNSNLACIYTVYCVEFGQLSFFLHVKTIGIFAGRLCLAELLDYLMFV